jgi:hypothetical protein
MGLICTDVKVEFSSPNACLFGRDHRHGFFLPAAVFLELLMVAVDKEGIGDARSDVMAMTQKQAENEREEKGERSMATSSAWRKQSPI